MKLALYCLIFLLCFGFIPKAAAQNFTVSTEAELRDAIDNNANINSQSDTITLLNSITISSSQLTIFNDANPLTIDGNGFTLSRTSTDPIEFPLFNVQNTGYLVLENIILTGGYFLNGGAIVNSGRVEIRDSLLSGNYAYDDPSSVNVEGYGGAIYNTRTLIIDNTVIRDNTSESRGGAIYTLGGAATLTISNSTIDNNTTTGFYGGGIFVSSPTTITSSTISNNSAYNSGGGIVNEDNLIIRNTTIFGNSVDTDFGGGIYNPNGIIEITNSTIVNNSARGGGGIAGDSNGTIALENTIILGNSQAIFSDCFVFGGTVITTNSNNILPTFASDGCPIGATDIVPAGDVTTVVESLADNGGPTQTMALVFGSPAIDAANNANCPTNDQRGVARSFDANAIPNNPELGDCDIGAYEIGASALYNSNPAEGSTIDLGSTLIGTEITTILEISEVGTATLLASLNSITGAHAADFRLIGLGTSIEDGDAAEEVAIICTPSGAGLRTASLTVSSNDPTQPLISYDLQCTGINLIVASASILGINQIVTEGNTTVNITVQLNVPTGFTDTGAVSVEIVDAGTGNATSPTDYTAFPPTIVNFGSVTAGTTPSQTVAVTLQDDSVVEGAEAIALTIRTVTGAAEVGQADSHVIVINDNDANIYAQASFVANSAIIDEDAGTLSIDVQLSIPLGFNLTGDVSLEISDALSGTATSGSDYTAFAPVNLTFVDAPFVPGTSYTQTLTLDILDDSAVEGVETVELGFTAISGPVELVSPAEFVVIINDDEIATVIVRQDGETVYLNGSANPAGDTDFIFKTVDNPFATVGQTVTYTIRARNPKTIPLTEVHIYDVFDQRLVDVRLISTSHGVGLFNGNTLTVSGFTLLPNEEAVIVVSARVGALRAGETVPNAAILESPDASVHVSNLALVGDNTEVNGGAAAQVFLIPNQLPSTGEIPLWRNWFLIGAFGLLSLGLGFVIIQQKR